MKPQSSSSTAGIAIQEQRLLIRRSRKEMLQKLRSDLDAGLEPPIRVMARIVQDLEREFAERDFDPTVIRQEIVNRTIGDINVRRITECEGAPAGPADFRSLAEELGIALPGEDVNGYIAPGEGHRWLREQMVTAERRLLSIGYDPRVYDIHSVGNPLLRGLLAEDMQQWGLFASERHVALGLGAADCIDKVLRGIAHLARLQSRPPGAVLFAAPGFNIPEMQAAAYGYRLHSVRTRAEDDFKLTAPLLSQSLEENLDITVVYLAVTNNPTTFAYSPDELLAIQGVLRNFAREGRRVHLLADLAYVGTGLPAEDRARMLSLASATDIADRTIYVSSWSKTHTLTGERFGWVLFGDAEFASAMGSSWTNSVASLPGEWQLRFMAYHALFRARPELIGKIRALYRLRRSMLRRQLESFDKEHGLFEHLYLDNDATIYNWSRLRPGVDCFAVFEKTGVAGIPGSTFGYSDNYIRFSVGILPVAMD
ncbi:pyridoxal phosphate-dependent aminotransferase [Nocardiopsis synnemataformans]|uniref:pyridoxal phosphate-dependent aminotransferase n=1 Tax=Nocardiopsis synnemataformans TaxID=61305 RepID=UPI003EB994C1